MDAKTFAEQCHGHIIGSQDTEISYILTDSRSLTFPDKTAFFSIVTQRNNGAKYITDLYRNGVRTFVVNDAFNTDTALATMPDACFVTVNNTLDALQAVAAAKRHTFQIPVVAITGSNGKTCVKEWLFQLLRQDYNITRSPRSYNSQIGVPLSVWQLDERSELAIFEAGISLPGEMLRLKNIIEPTIGIITNIGDAHQENFKSLEQKCREKMILFDNADVVIYNKDSEVIDKVASELKSKTWTWGNSSDSNVVIRQIESMHDQLTGNLVTRIDYSYGEEHHGHYTLPFTDKASVNNSLHCLALMLYLDYSPRDIALRMLSLEGIAMRLEVKQGINGCQIINDSYNSDFASLVIALDFLDQQRTLHSNMGCTLIMSDILQNGIPSEELYEQVADSLRNRNVTHFVGIGTDIGAHRKAFEGIDCGFYPTTDDYLASSEWQKISNQVVLIKGSRKYGFEKISKRLEMQAHETVLEVNLTALIDNLNYFRRRLAPSTKMMCMVKAFAYGSGIVDVSRALQRHHVDYLAVALADEGALLRREGITLPIVVMNPENNALDVIIENNLEPNVYNISKLEEVINAVERQGLTSYPIHIKIDSGMHRLGFEMPDMDELISRLKHQQAVVVKSVFSHLAGADSERFDDFTREQISRFEQCADKLQQSMPYTIMKHILNSAGIERFTDSQHDMVRLGIGLYGFSALKDVRLKNVCTLKTVILQIKTVHAGESIGYSRNTWVDKDRSIAVIPIGYADGFDRRLGNGAGHVIVNGVRCPVMGNVCMDVAMIDVTEANAHEGDSVEIFGDQLPIEELAEQLDTITYEILTSVSRRVKRVYYQE
ncbi:MAG: bifunctional UDP-N-acetylmuramoyl-tripeptide:D-alanyl-D-alanine ligase/alanine racemase [Paludibacteraceae bacterium]|nr:bifunctional UDP-N-acetylmuramoyl-tripeptide:D-alanyl-D-alanine ligase/alanine racemase [Paludibacteraceae bacterium]